MAAVDLLTRDDLVAVLDELRRVRVELAALRADHEAELVSPTEAARRLGVSVRSIQRRIRAGELPSVRVGGSRRVRLDGVVPPAVSRE